MNIYTKLKTIIDNRIEAEINEWVEHINSLVEEIKTDVEKEINIALKPFKLNK